MGGTCNNFTSFANPSSLYTSGLTAFRAKYTNIPNQYLADTTNINALLDNAQGASGYYGIFGTHYDMSNTER